MSGSGSGFQVRNVRIAIGISSLKCQDRDRDSKFEMPGFQDRDRDVKSEMSGWGSDSHPFLMLVHFGASPSPPLGAKRGGLGTVGVEVGV